MLTDSALTRIPLILDSFLTLWMFVLSAGLGRRLMLRLRLPGADALERGLFAATLGLGALSYLPFLLFTLRIGKPPVLFGASLLLTLVLHADIRAVLRAALRLTCRGIKAWSSPGNAPLWLLATTTALLVLVTFVQACCYATDTDGLHYHLLAPLKYLDEGRFYYMPTFLHLNWSLGIEMLFAFGQAVNRHYAAGLVQFGLGILLMTTVFAFGRRIASPTVGWLAACLTLSWIRGEMTWAYIDIGLMQYTLVALYAFHVGWLRLRSRTEPAQGALGSPWFLLSALAVGLSGTAKLHGLLVVILFTVYAYVALWQVASEHGAARWLAALRPALAFLVVGTLVLLPWIVRCFAMTRSPIYPYFGGLFGAVDWSAEWHQRLSRFLQTSLTLRTRNLTHDQIFQVRAIASLLMIALAAVLSLPRFVQPMRPLIIFVFLFMLLQIATIGIYVRYMLPVVPVILLLIFWGVRRLVTEMPVGRWAASLFVILWLLGQGRPAQAVRGNIATLRGALPVALGLVSRDDYLTRKLSAYPAFQWCNNNLGPEALVATGILDAYNSLIKGRSICTHYYLQNAVRYDTYENMIRDLKRLGVTHLIVQEKPATPEQRALQDEEAKMREKYEYTPLRRAAQDYGEKVFFHDGYAIYALRLP